MNKYLDADKALEVVIYISRCTSNIFASSRRSTTLTSRTLEKYGRSIAGDYYVAMRSGRASGGLRHHKVC